MAATRLTEQEVHAACAEMAQQGEYPTALKLLDKLGRGSLTTITKYLNSWRSPKDLKTGITPKAIEFSKHVVELETLRFRYDLSLTELHALKIELQAVKMALSESEMKVANLEEQLAVYKSLKLAEEQVKQSPPKRRPTLKNHKPATFMKPPPDRLK